MENNLKIPVDSRHKFSEPLGRLIAGTREETIAEVEKIFKSYLNSNVNFNFYIVGDIVTADFLSNPFLKSYVKICIIDEKTQRLKFKLEQVEFFDRTIEFKNPIGTIQKESWLILRNAINSKKKILLKVIEGEEDILVLPLVLELPTNDQAKNFVFYGQPPITDSRRNIPQGIVLVDVNKSIQQTVKKYLALMQKF